MQVVLAGFNVDYRLVDLIQKIVSELPGFQPDNVHLRDYLGKLLEEPLTPETLSAAYARISRSDKSIKELRDDARASLSRARRSNEEIVFGFGHASVAEHAVFNVDFTEISRLAIEELESHRLASFTERSQRYVGLEPEYHVPDEIHGAGFRLEMEDYCQSQFEAYRSLQSLILRHLGDDNRSDREKALQDARYVLPLAVCGQVGMTINARTAEHMVRSFRQSPLAEVQMMGKQLHDEVKRVAPSLIRYTESNPARTACERRLTSEIKARFHDAEPASEEVVLIHAPRQGEEMAAAAVAFSFGASDIKTALNVIDGWSDAERRRFLSKAHSYLEAHESLRRELELGYFIFSVTLSASAFAQLKRHRISTIIKQNYQPRLGFTTPAMITDAGGEAIFFEAIERAEVFYAKVKEKLPPANHKAAQYVLTNAHRRRVIFQANARELTHLSRLRLDKHAQWDIRRLSGRMLDMAAEACPALMQFACGRDEFPAWKKSQRESLEESC